MRTLPALALACLLSACATSRSRAKVPYQLPGSTWARDTTVHWYDVEGESAEALRRSLDERGPPDQNGNRNDAYTAWHVTWRFPLQAQEDGCVTGPVTADVRITVTLPRWHGPDDGRSPLARQWRQYLDALRVHESGHRETGLSAAAEIIELLPQLPPQPTCADADREANEAARKVLERHRERDADYDAETRHGATQGAVFP